MTRSGGFSGANPAAVPPPSALARAASEARDAVHHKDPRFSGRLALPLVPPVESALLKTEAEYRAWPQRRLIGAHVTVLLPDPEDEGGTPPGMSWRIRTAVHWDPASRWGHPDWVQQPPSGSTSEAQLTIDGASRPAMLIEAWRHVWLRTEVEDLLLTLEMSLAHYLDPHPQPPVPALQIVTFENLGQALEAMRRISIEAPRLGENMHRIE